jgi:hypothetical protein
MSDTARKRRWFRFSLRTVFMLMTAFGMFLGWLVYQLNWIRQRNEYVAEKQTIWAAAHHRVFQAQSGAARSRVDIRIEDVSPPSQLWLFGERGVSSLQMCVWVQDIHDEQCLIDAFKSERARALRLFPETKGRISLHWVER